MTPVPGVKPLVSSNDTEDGSSAATLLKSINSKLNFEQIFDSLTGQMTDKEYGRAERKLRSKEIKKKKFRNLEGLLSIQVGFTKGIKNWQCPRF